MMSSLINLFRLVLCTLPGLYMLSANGSKGNLLSDIGYLVIVVISSIILEKSLRTISIWPKIKAELESRESHERELEVLNETGFLYTVSMLVSIIALLFTIGFLPLVAVIVYVVFISAIVVKLVPEEERVERVVKDVDDKIAEQAQESNKEAQEA